MHEIDFKDKNYDFNKYDFLIFGFPTYHCEPSISSMEFIDKMPELKKPLNAFVFTTCGLYAGNSLRISIKKLKTKGVIASGYMRFRGPGSDELVYNIPSFISFPFQYEKGIKNKLLRALNMVQESISNSSNKIRIPLYKWYVPINNIFKFFGERHYDSFKNNISILEDRCTNCNYCVKNCIRICFKEGNSFPVFDPTNCEFCLKCIHNCPARAIVFSDSMKEKPRFNKAFYDNLKIKIDID